MGDDLRIVFKDLPTYLYLCLITPSIQPLILPLLYHYVLHAIDNSFPAQTTPVLFLFVHINDDGNCILSENYYCMIKLRVIKLQILQVNRVFSSCGCGLHLLIIRGLLAILLLIIMGSLNYR